MTELDSTLLGVIAGLLSSVLATVLASRQAQVARQQWLKERPALFRTILATVVGTILMALAYFLLFTTTGTGGYGDVAGMLNANQGVLTLVGIIIAAMTVVISVVGRESVNLAGRRAETQKLHKRVRLAMEETFHNLMHVGQILGADGHRVAQHAPQVSFLSLEALMRDPGVERLDDNVLQVGSTLLRFADYMRDVPVMNSFTPAALARDVKQQTGSHRPTADGTTVAYRGGGPIPAVSARAAEQRRHRDEVLTTTLQRFALHSLRLIAEIDANHHVAVCKAMRTPLRQRLSAALRRGSAGQVHFHSSDPEVDGRELRAKGQTLMVWSNDAPGDVRGVEVIQVGQTVLDMFADAA